MALTELNQQTPFKASADIVHGSFFHSQNFSEGCAAKTADQAEKTQP